MYLISMFIMHYLQSKLILAIEIAAPPCTVNLSKLGYSTQRMVGVPQYISGSAASLK